jgi:hypothetical protein
MKEIVISNLMRAKNKQSFFALHQIQSKIKKLYPDVKIEFHILWDDTNELNLQNEEKWSNLIDSQIENLYSYNKEFFNNYVTEYYGFDYTEKFKTWKAIYFILMAHYLRRVKLKHYYLIYDDDILINDDFKHICDLLLERTPILISEPMNASCDKVMFQKLVNLFGENFYHVYIKNNPKQYGFNAGFQGIDLGIYDDFLSKDRFQHLLDLFEYKSIYDKNGEEIWGDERFIIDTQQQSFFGLMNIVLASKSIHILDPEEYFVMPNWGVHPKYGQLTQDDENEGWGYSMESKITHFIGHTVMHGINHGKPKPFLKKVDKYLKENNFI